MNLMGKIFTFLIFLLSICFLVIAVMVGASHRNWKDAAAENKRKADQAQAVLDQANTSSNEKEKQLNAERVARTFQLSQLESQLAIARQRRDEKEKQLTEELVISQQRLQELKRAEDRLAELDTELERLKGENIQLSENIAVQSQKMVNLTSQLYEVQGKRDSLELMNKDLTAQLAQKIKVMNANGLTDESLTDHIEPAVEGIVLGVSDDIIVISLGRDDGLKPGHEVDIYRGGRYVGQAVVVRTEHDRAAAKLSPELLRTSVQKEDNVTTKL